MILVDVLPFFKDPDPGALKVPDPQHCFYEMNTNGFLKSENKCLEINFSYCCCLL